MFSIACLDDLSQLTASLYVNSSRESNVCLIRLCKMHDVGYFYIWRVPEFVTHTVDAPPIFENFSSSTVSADAPECDISTTTLFQSRCSAKLLRKILGARLTRKRAPNIYQLSIAVCTNQSRISAALYACFESL